MTSFEERILKKTEELFEKWAMIKNLQEELQKAPPPPPPPPQSKKENLEFSGIAKVPSSSVHIDPSVVMDALVDTEKEGLTRLPPAKLHVTLIHQSNIKGLLKAEKKALKQGGTAIVFPETPLRPIGVGSGSRTTIVRDTNPNTGDERVTARIILDDNAQAFLSNWVSEFCRLNEVERDERELQRVYHVSFANKTGNPMDSVR